MIHFLKHAQPLRLALVALLSAGIAGPAPVLADPPAHAPAHGWRKKNDPYYQGYAGKKWDKDYGITAGKCNLPAVGAVLGGAVGGAIGSQVGKGDGRAIAILIGTVAGAVIGAKIGSDIQNEDRACVGHALELAKAGQAVTWSNPATGIAYSLTPGKSFERDGRPCREFRSQSSKNGAKESTRGMACRAADGEWRITS